MAGDDDRSRIYVISDLHIGGDEQLGTVDFREELLSFLERLAAEDEPTELVINGDAFGLWEYTDVHGVEAFDELVSSYPHLFEQLRETGESVDITLVPGNHDHDLAAFDGFVERFAEYNVDLVQDAAIRRRVGDRIVHLEHGHQHDPNNRFEDFGNPYERPLGYYYNTHVVSRAGHLSSDEHFDWLSDVQAVTPTERMPSWLLSKYVYRELHPLLRFSLVPFLLLFNISVLLAIIAALDLLGIWSEPVEATAAFLGQFGLAGTAVWLVIGVNVVIAGVLALAAIPLSLIIRDVRNTVERFDVIEDDLTVNPEAPYIEAASELLAAEPEIAVYCYGHTHRPLINRVGDGIIANSGTWLKRLHRREVITGVLPPIYYPSYQLGALRIEETDEGIEVAYEAIEKPNPISEDLSWLERLLAVGRVPEPEIPETVTIPKTTDE